MKILGMVTAISLIVTLVLGLVLGISALIGWITMQVWNLILVPWAGAPTISFWLAWAVWIVLSLLFGKIGSVIMRKD